MCLGAQLLAVAAGGTARPGSGEQIGWGGIALSASAAGNPLFAGLPGRLDVPHWHRDTMDLPDRAVLLASCDRCPVSPEDPPARPNPEPALRSAGWRLTEYDDAEEHFLALATAAS